jgi:ketosteroid isomerase-like protein
MKYLILLLATVVPSLAQSSPDIRQVESQLSQLLVRGDYDQYGSRLADDYLRINMNGTQQNKQETLSYLKSGNTKFIDLDAANLNVRSSGDCAIANGDLTSVQRINGKVVTTIARFTDVFMKKNGQWLLTSTQLTTAPKQ